MIAAFLLCAFAGFNAAAEQLPAPPDSTISETSAGWVKYDGNPVLGGQYGTCFDVSVLKEEGKYRMWVSWRPKASIALVESADGIHWSQPQIVLGPRRKPAGKTTSTARWS